MDLSGFEVRTCGRPRFAPDPHKMDGAIPTLARGRSPKKLRVTALYFKAAVTG